MDLQEMKGVYFSFSDEDILDDFIGKLSVGLDRESIKTTYYIRSEKSWNNPKGKEIAGSLENGIRKSSISQEMNTNDTSHLYAGLGQGSITPLGAIFEDSYEDNIREYSISLVIFSRNYASSDWCLKQLVYVLQCRETNRQIVVPVFYHIDPSLVRKQTESFRDAFLKHEKIFRTQEVKAWKAALYVASSLCGWHPKNPRSDAEFIEEIVGDILKKKLPSNLNISIHSLGYDLSHEYLNLFLQLGVDDVLVVGIAGEATMGKTVMAQALFDRIFRAFNGCSFISGVGQKSATTEGVVQLQKQLLFDLLGEDINITSVTIGAAEIKERLCRKTVLIVLDGVDGLYQLLALVGSRNWFGLGSKIIITTRMLPLLHDFGVDQIFMAQGNPLPLDIQKIWEPYQQSCLKIAELKEYIQSYGYKTDETVKYLEECLIREREKGEIQAQMIRELNHASCSCAMLEDVGSSSSVREAEVVDPVAADI
ncbi:TMV resistance protein N [Morus notabilis]|uniref:TMV resistance protein N n=1 Tax=Morus notabilis TaxID=981085 RepID=W9RLN8_9ROSA|nr:TMV resistance protein N [Morus notabilis]EXB96358.1 TMV resistance protein N [Morus notabilis]